MATATIHPCPCCDLGGLDYTPCPSRVAIDAAEARAAKAETESGALTKRLADMAARISLKGWWCLLCVVGTWNGEEQARRYECRTCGKAKSVHT